MPSSGVQTCRSEEHTSELQSHSHLVCRLLLEKKKNEANRRAAGRCVVTQQGQVSVEQRSVCVLCCVTSHPRASYAPPFCLFSFFFLKDRPPPEISPFPSPTLSR